MFLSGPGWDFSADRRIPCFWYLFCYFCDFPRSVIKFGGGGGGGCVVLYLWAWAKAFRHWIILVRQVSSCFIGLQSHPCTVENLVRGRLGYVVPAIGELGLEAGFIPIPMREKQMGKIRICWEKWGCEFDLKMRKGGCSVRKEMQNYRKKEEDGNCMESWHERNPMNDNGQNSEADRQGLPLEKGELILRVGVGEVAYWVTLKAKILGNINKFALCLSRWPYTS